jgi:pimeloyl-ACP methyl ester carboxylesterase
MRTTTTTMRTFPYATRFIDTPHGRIACFDEGEGPPVVLVHGLGGDFTHFEYVAPALREFRLIGMDMPGCGESCKPATRHTIERYAQATLDALTALGIERATLIGHSAGGLVCTQAALLAPDRVDRLILINSAGLRGYSFPERLVARALFRPWILRILLRANAHRILGRAFGERNEHTRKFAKDVIGNPRATLPDLCKVFADLIPDLLMPTVAQNGHRLTMPTYIIWGARDRLVPLATVERAAGKVPRARLEVLASCGHMPMIERPAETAALLLSFLNDEPGRQKGAA